MTVREALVLVIKAGGTKKEIILRAKALLPERSWGTFEIQYYKIKKGEKIRDEK